MQTPDNKIDTAMQAYAKKWLSSLDNRRPSTSLGYFFVGFFLLIWSSSLTTQLGYDLKKGIGALIFIGIGLGLTLIIIMTNSLMTKVGLGRPIRSAIWLSAIIGPYINLSIYHLWKIPIVSHMIGFAAAILAFLISITLDKVLERKPKKAD